MLDGLDAAQVRSLLFFDLLSYAISHALVHVDGAVREGVRVRILAIVVARAALLSGELPLESLNDPVATALPCRLILLPLVLV